MLISWSASSNPTRNKRTVKRRRVDEFIRTKQRKKKEETKSNKGLAKVQGRDTRGEGFVEGETQKRSKCEMKKRGS